MRCGEACWGTWQEGPITHVGRVCDHPQDDERPKVVVCFVLAAAAGNGWAALTEYREDFCPGGAQMFPGGKQEPGESVEATLVREMREELYQRPVEYRLLDTVQSADWTCRPWLVTRWESINGAELPQATLDGGDPLTWRLLSEQAADDRWPASRQIAMLALRALGLCPVSPPLDERNEHLTAREVARLPATDAPREEMSDEEYRAMLRVPGRPD